MLFRQNPNLYPESWSITPRLFCDSHVLCTKMIQNELMCSNNVKDHNADDGDNQARVWWIPCRRGLRCLGCGIDASHI